MTYGGVLLGSGLPYWVLTAGFLFLHILSVGRDRSRAGVADSAPPGDRCRRCAGRWRPWSCWCSSTSSWSGCPESASHARRPHHVRQCGGRVSQPDLARACLRRDSARRGHRLHAGPDRDPGHHAADDADAQAAAQPGDPGAGLRLCRRDLWRQPHRHPAQHSRHAGQRRRLPRRLSAGAPGAGRPRHGHRHHRLGASARCSAWSASRCSRRCWARWR